MSRLGSRLLIGAFVVLVALAASWLFAKLQPYEEVVEHGPSPEAQRNSYLAAELFLRSLDLPVTQLESSAGLETLPSRGQTLLLLGDRRNLTPRQTDRLLEWAAAGGHLVVVAERIWHEQAGKSG